MSLCARGAVEYPTLSVPLAHYTVYLLQAPKGCLCVPGVLLNTLHCQYPWHIIVYLLQAPKGCLYVPWVLLNTLHSQYPLAHYTVYLLQAPKGCLYVPGVLLNTLHCQYPWHIIQSICYRPLKGVFMCQGCC